MNIKIKIGAKKVDGISAKNFEAMLSKAIPVLIFLKVQHNMIKIIPINTHIIIAGARAPT